MARNPSIGMNSFIIGDDNLLFCLGLEMLLKMFDSSFNMLHALTSFEVVNLFCTQHSKIIFMDLSLPALDFSNTTNEIRKIDPTVKIIGTTKSCEGYNSDRILKAGANGVLCKDENLDKVKSSLSAIINEGVHFNSDSKSSFSYYNYVKENGSLRGDLREDLTKREIEVLLLICQQFSTKEISEHLSLSAKTVDIHRGHIMEKIHAKNMIGLVLYAIEKQYISYPKIA